MRESTGEPVARSEERNRETISTPRFVRIPSTMNSFCPAEGSYPQNYVADQSRLHFSEIQFDRFPRPSTFSCRKTRFKTQVSACSSSPSEMVDSVDDLKSSRSIQGCTHFPNFEVLDAKIAYALNKDHPEFLLQEEGQSGGTESPKRGPVSVRKTDRLPDLRSIPGHWSQRFCRELCRPVYNCSLQ